MFEQFANEVPYFEGSEDKSTRAICNLERKAEFCWLAFIKITLVSKGNFGGGLALSGDFKSKLT